MKSKYYKSNEFQKKEQLQNHNSDINQKTVEIREGKKTNKHMPLLF